MDILEQKFSEVMAQKVLFRIQDEFTYWRIVGYLEEKGIAHAARVEHNSFHVALNLNRHFGEIEVFELDAPIVQDLLKEGTLAGYDEDTLPATPDTDTVTQETTQKLAEVYNQYSMLAFGILIGIIFLGLLWKLFV